MVICVIDVTIIICFVVDWSGHFLTAEWLFQAYKSCESEKDAERLLENIEVRKPGVFFISAEFLSKDWTCIDFL